MRMLCYCTQINLPVQLEIESQFLILAFVGKQAGSLVSFPAWVPTRCSGNLCWLTLLLRDVTREPCWNRGGYLMLVLRWDGSVVTLLVLRHYGVYTVFDSRVRYLSQPVLRRESSGPSGSSFRRWRASFESRKRAFCDWRVVLNSPIWTSPTGGWSNQSVGMGRSPAHVHGFNPRYTLWRKINFYPCIKTLTRFTHL